MLILKTAVECLFAHYLVVGRWVVLVDQESHQGQGESHLGNLFLRVLRGK